MTKCKKILQATTSISPVLLVIKEDQGQKIIYSIPFSLASLLGWLWFLGRTWGHQVWLNAGLGLDTLYDQTFKRLIEKITIGCTVTIILSRHLFLELASI